MNIFERIKYFFLAQKAKSLQKKLKNTTKKSYTNKTSKKVYGAAADLEINAQTQKIIEDIKNNVSAIVKQTNCDPEKLLDYIKAAKTPVYKIDNADKLLNLIHEEEGVIFEKSGLTALYLSIITGRKWSFKTPAMFILRNGVIDKFYMLHNFYRWYSMKSDLPGFEQGTQEKFKIFMNDEDETLFNRLSMADILSLKEAIARDREATDFVLEYTKQTEGSQNVIDKIKNSGGADV